jgi:hypothetical protein
LTDEQLHEAESMFRRVARHAHPPPLVLRRVRSGELPGARVAEAPGGSRHGISRHQGSRARGHREVWTRFHGSYLRSTSQPIGPYAWLGSCAAHSER